jgi:shikimate dehydrogenase
LTDRYAVIGNPIAHSRSPLIHAQFAQQTGQDIEYGRLLAPLTGFAAMVDAFRTAGGRGLNVTIPFKVEACSYATRHGLRAQAAGAVNTLRFDDAGAVFGDNTDGVGLVRDIEQRLQCPLTGARVLLLGAGGAARGVVRPLLDAKVAALMIANRTAAKAQSLAQSSADARVAGAGLARLAAVNELYFDVIVNATSAGLTAQAPSIDASCYSQARLAYDVVYGSQPTRFMREALAGGCETVSDGLGMLIEQAAESFFVWRGVRPQTGPVYASLRAQLDREP